MSEAVTITATEALKRQEEWVSRLAAEMDAINPPPVLILPRGLRSKRRRQQTKSTKRLLKESVPKLVRYSTGQYVMVTAMHHQLRGLINGPTLGEPKP